MTPRESSRRPSQSRKRIEESTRRKQDRRRHSEAGQETRAGERRRSDANQNDETRDARHAARREARRTERRQHEKDQHTERREERRSRALSAGALADLNRSNDRQERRAERQKKTKRDYREVDQDADEGDRRHRRHSREHDRDEKSGRKKSKRVVSGAVMEEGRARNGHAEGNSPGGWRMSGDQSLNKEDYYHKPRRKKSRKKLWILIGASAALLIIIIVAVVVSQKNKAKNDDGLPSGGLDAKDRKNIPPEWRSTYLDPWTWATTEAFNTTFTADTIGDLPVMGLNTDWDDSARANDRVPPLNEPWGSYAKKPALGVGLGGWLSLEPFITPSLFDYDSKRGVVDEWTLSQQLGPDKSRVLEEHYATFVTEDDFKRIAEAGLDHVRIPFSYWAVEVYDGDPYLFRTSWRYLLRAIEWARKYGLRVNIGLHGLPGSQNGWNHSGRVGSIGWLNGTNGKLNADRSLQIHDRLSKFFAQDRYKNIITHYGLANEPRMTHLDPAKVVTWTEAAYKVIRDNGVQALAVFGDGFMGLDNWQGLMPGYDDMVLDVHQYVIFNVDQLAYTHKEKVEYACKGWSDQTELSMDRNRGYGPTLFAEWSQADTDCTPLLNGGIKGNRWEGTLSGINSPKCPSKDSSCSCSKALEGPSDWSDEYKTFLRMFAEAQMHSFEKGWGWWYWTWRTESAPLWSYETGLKAGILPEKAWERKFNCDSEVPDFEAAGLPENY